MNAILIVCEYTDGNGEVGTKWLRLGVAFSKSRGQAKRTPFARHLWG
jgi:hypothetical protein